MVVRFSLPWLGALVEVFVGLSDAIERSCADLLSRLKLMGAYHGD